MSTNATDRPVASIDLALVERSFALEPRVVDDGDSGRDVLLLDGHHPGWPWLWRGGRARQGSSSCWTAVPGRRAVPS
ncbi:hypothetical protein NKG05_24190 [Oerskovia sp. M15]